MPDLPQERLEVQLERVSEAKGKAREAEQGAGRLQSFALGRTISEKTVASCTRLFYEVSGKIGTE